MLKVAAREKSDTLKAKTFYRMASAYMEMGIADSAYRYAQLSKQLSQKNKFYKGLAVSSNYLGQVKNYTGFQDSAIFYFQKAKEYYNVLGDTNRAAGMLNNLGIVYRQQGNYFKALNCYFESLKIMEHFSDSFAIANSYHNLAQVYSESKDTVNGLKYHQGALEIRRKIGDLSGVGSSLVPLALFYKNEGKIAQALQYLEEALSIAEKLNEEESIAIATYNLGSVFYDQKELEKAMHYFERSLAISKKNGNVIGIAVCMESMGVIMIDRKEFKMAISYLEEAYTLSRQSGAMDVTGGISEKLANLYEKTGEHKKALSYFKINRNIHDSLFNEENIRKLTSENIKYEHEKEELVARKEQEKKDALVKEEAFRKNLLIWVTLLFLAVVSFFSYKLFQRFKENSKQKVIIEEQQKEMIASITYAKRIQYALLPNEDFLKTHLPQHFVLFKPKDIVSGDFYWATIKDEFLYFAVCDCTGHGVPGAFMSLLNTNYLNEAINEKGIVEPGKVLDHVREQLLQNLSGGRDGMDAVLLRLPLKRSATSTFTYAAANNSGVLIQNGSSEELMSDSMPIGLGEKKENFRTFEKTVEKGDMLYLYTDGFADQFGGPKEKKFKYKQLNQQLIQSKDASMNEQHDVLLAAFEAWRGKLEQVDDVCIVGLRF